MAEEPSQNKTNWLLHTIIIIGIIAGVVTFIITTFDQDTAARILAKATLVAIIYFISVIIHHIKNYKPKKKEAPPVKLPHIYLSKRKNFSTAPVKLTKTRLNTPPAAENTDNK